MIDGKKLVDEVSLRWDREASDLERAAARADTPIERRLQEMHARVKRGCAQELRLEAQKVTHRGR